jgi:hypothetical protein
MLNKPGSELQQPSFCDKTHETARAVVAAVDVLGQQLKKAA